MCIKGEKNTAPRTGIRGKRIKGKKKHPKSLGYETSVTSKDVHVKIQQNKTIALNNKKNLIKLNISVKPLSLQGQDKNMSLKLVSVLYSQIRRGKVMSTNGQEIPSVHADRERGLVAGGTLSLPGSR